MNIKNCFSLLISIASLLGCTKNEPTITKYIINGANYIKYLSVSCNKNERREGSIYYTTYFLQVCRKDESYTFDNAYLIMNCGGGRLNILYDGSLTFNWTYESDIPMSDAQVINAGGYAVITKN